MLYNLDSSLPQMKRSARTSPVRLWGTKKLNEERMKKVYTPTTSTMIALFVGSSLLPGCWLHTFFREDLERIRNGVPWGTYSDVMYLFIFVALPALFYLWAARAKLTLDGDRLHYRTIFGNTTVRLIDYEGILGHSTHSARFPIFNFWKDGRIVTIRMGRFLTPAENEELTNRFSVNCRLASHTTYRCSQEAQWRAQLLAVLCLSVVILLLFKFHSLIALKPAFDLIACACMVIPGLPLIWICSVRIKVFDNNLNYYSVFKSYCLPLSRFIGSSHSHLIFEDEVGKTIRPRIWMLSPQDVKTLKTEIESLLSTQFEPFWGVV